MNARLVFSSLEQNYENVGDLDTIFIQIQYYTINFRHSNLKCKLCSEFCPAGSKLIWTLIGVEHRKCYCISRRAHEWVIFWHSFNEPNFAFLLRNTDSNRC